MLNDQLFFQPRLLRHMEQVFPIMKTNNGQVLK